MSVSASFRPYQYLFDSIAEAHFQLYYSTKCQQTTIECRTISLISGSKMVLLENETDGKTTVLLYISSNPIC